MDHLPENARTIDAITDEILRLKADAGNAIISIGERLIEAKAMLGHGEWLPWLTERAEFSERTAQDFMRLAREWRNPQALADLGKVKALKLLLLPPAEREEFMREHDVIDMTSRELEQAVRERDEARKNLEETKKNLDRANQKIDDQAEQIKTLESRPVEVAVEVDEQAIEAAEISVREEMQKVIDALTADKEKAERQLRDAKKQAEPSGAAEAMAEAERLRAETEELRKKLALSDGAVTAFKVHFSAWQRDYQAVKTALGETDETTAEKLRAAVAAQVANWGKEFGRAWAIIEITRLAARTFWRCFWAMMCIAVTAAGSRRPPPACQGGCIFRSRWRGRLAGISPTRDIS